MIYAVFPNTNEEADQQSTWEEIATSINYGDVYFLNQPYYFLTFKTVLTSLLCFNIREIVMYFRALHQWPVQLKNI